MNWQETLIYLVMVISWVFGVAIAKGFWPVLIAVLFPPYGWVILAEYVLEKID